MSQKASVSLLSKLLTAGVLCELPDEPFGEEGEKSFILRPDCKEGIRPALAAKEGELVRWRACVPAGSVFHLNRSSRIERDALARPAARSKEPRDL